MNVVVISDIHADLLVMTQLMLPYRRYESDQVSFASLLQILRFIRHLDFNFLSLNNWIHGLNFRVTSAHLRLEAINWFGTTHIPLSLRRYVGLVTDSVNCNHLIIPFEILFFTNSWNLMVTSAWKLWWDTAIFYTAFLYLVFLILNRSSHGYCMINYFFSRYISIGTPYDELFNRILIDAAK